MTATTSRPSWSRRIATTAVLALFAVVVLRWLGSDPSWIGVVAATTAVAAAAWFSSDIAAHDVASGSWPLAQPAPTERPSLDGRLAVLRRMADSAAEPPPDDAPTRPAATELQAILRRAAEHRLNRRSDGAPLPPDLASYLTATPAPRVPIDQLDRLLTRIEEL